MPPATLVSVTFIGIIYGILISILPCRLLLLFFRFRVGLSIRSKPYTFS